jgi:catechol 2,3-dioxygenase-like lactoylglutathione lyase family enzyme
MPQPYIEHVNLTVSDPERMADLLHRLFDWHVRWEGAARDNGRVIHVGDERTYLAVYTPPGGPQAGDFEKGRPLNAGLVPFAHADYDPGRRFYFLDYDGTEFEIVSYA